MYDALFFSNVSTPASFFEIQDKIRLMHIHRYVYESSLHFIIIHVKPQSIHPMFEGLAVKSFSKLFTQPEHNMIPLGIASHFQACLGESPSRIYSIFLKSIVTPYPLSMSYYHDMHAQAQQNSTILYIFHFLLLATVF